MNYDEMIKQGYTMSGEGIWMPPDDESGEFTLNLASSNSEDRIVLNKDPRSRYKYDEDEILDELRDYITGTYNAHYSAGDDKIQTLDLIEACGDGEAFCRSNILKYASRYDK